MGWGDGVGGWWRFFLSGRGAGPRPAPHSHARVCAGQNNDISSCAARCVCFALPPPARRFLFLAV